MTEEEATYVTAEGKMRDALEDTRKFLEGIIVVETLSIPRKIIMSKIDDALAMGTDDIGARTMALHSNDEPDLKIDLLKELDAKIDDMKSFIIMQGGGHIRQQLYELPEQIQTQALIVSKLTVDIEKLRQSIAYSKNKALELVLSATNDGKPMYSNDKMRNVAVEQLLREDESYLLSTDDIGRKEAELRREQIQLNFLHNQFKAYLAISGMAGVR